jgi:fumarate reductase subunit C
MDPQQQPDQPQNPVASPLQTPVKSHKKLAISLLVVPTALFVLSLVLGLIAAQIGDTSAQDGELFAQVSPLKQILNILTFACAGIGFLTWLPGLIVGIILLAKKK